MTTLSSFKVFSHSAVHRRAVLEYLQVNSRVCLIEYTLDTFFYMFTPVSHRQNNTEFIYTGFHCIYLRNSAARKNRKVLIKNIKILMAQEGTVGSPTILIILMKVQRTGFGISSLSRPKCTAHLQTKAKRKEIQRERVDAPKKKIVMGDLNRTCILSHVAL